MRPIPFFSFAQQLQSHHESMDIVQGVAIDSRKIKPGDVFFALPGNRVDGHAFLEEAAKKGAVGAVVPDFFREGPPDFPLVHVPDVLHALQDYARMSLMKRKTKVLAITGSLGKTTTKEFVETLLRPSFRVFANPLSYNSQRTLPLTILMADETEEYLILEMGMSQKGEMHNLVSIAPPHIALITTVAVQHANNFTDGLTGISREKAEIFSHPKTELGILHRDMHHYEEACQTGTCIKKSFSMTNRDADFYLEPIPGGIRIIPKNEPHADISLKLPLNIYYHNFLAAVALARSLKVSWPDIQEAARSIKLPPMRFEQIEKQGITFINDAYNANPDSMKAALENLPAPKSGGRVIGVLGEMDALGMYTEGGHASVAETALQHLDVLLCLGARCETMKKIWKREKKEALLFDSRQALENTLIELAKPGDVVLLKGARVHALEEILNKF